MKISFHYDLKDDVFTIFSDIAPSETIEFNEFINIDINREKGIVGLEVFDASEFFGKQNPELTRRFLSDLKDIDLEYDEWRNVFFINLKFTGEDGRIIVQKLPPLKKSEYTSPLIANA